MKKKKNTKTTKKRSVIKKKVLKETTDKFTINPQIKKQLVLHIGCDVPTSRHGLDNRFDEKNWHEVRLAFNDSVKADINAKPTNLKMIADKTFDAIWIPYKISDFFDHEVREIFQESLRILKNDGYLLLATANLKDVAEKIYKQGIDSVLYKVGDNAVTPIDVLFGFGKHLKEGNDEAQQHSGFTPPYLATTLRDCGFRDIKVQRDGYKLWAISYKRPTDTEQNKRIRIINDDINMMMKARDYIDQPPENEVQY